jgi:RNA polymerase sigma-B factor
MTQVALTPAASSPEEFVLLPRPRSAPGKLDKQCRRDRSAELLAESAHTTDELRRRGLHDEVVSLNMDVAESVADRFRNRGVDEDDLRQVAYLGLVKAVRRFDPDVGHAFLSFAVPTIRGEVRRHFRDHGWVVRPPRRIQELQPDIVAVSDTLTHRLGRSPRPEEVAEVLDEDTGSVAEAMAASGCFTPTSLDAPRGAGTSTLGDLLPDGDDPVHAVDARVVLAPAVRSLCRRDQRIIYLRFFEGRTQAEIGEAIGVTQMQVSRILTRILRTLREEVVAAGHQP